MRTMVIAFGLAALAVASVLHPAAAEKSKMGCEIGKEVWSATDGKCVEGTSKWHKKTTTKPEKKAPLPAKK